MHPVRSRVGFTLIEILVVVVIIGVLSIIGVSKYTEFITQSRQKGCFSNQSTLDRTVGAWESQNASIPQFLSDNKTSVSHSLDFNSRGVITRSTLAALAHSPGNALKTGAPDEESILRLTKDQKVFICPEYANQQGGFAQALAKADNPHYAWVSSGAGIAVLKGRRRGVNCVNWNGGKAVGPDGSDESLHVE